MKDELFFDHYIEMEIASIIESKTSAVVVDEWYQRVRRGHMLTMNEFEFVTLLYRQIRAPLCVIYYEMHFRFFGVYLSPSDEQMVVLHTFYN
jgi:hypothetical protein